MANSSGNPSQGADDDGELQRQVQRIAENFKMDKVNEAMAESLRLLCWRMDMLHQAIEDGRTENIEVLED